MSGKTEPTVVVSDWYGVPTSNGALSVLLHRDSPRLAPYHARATEMFTSWFADNALNEMRRDREREADR